MVSTNKYTKGANIMGNFLIDDLARYTFLSGITFSNDGQNACFAVHHANLEDNNYKSNLWLYNTEAKKYFQLTSLDKESQFIWLKDNEHILFPGIRDPKDKTKIENGEEFTQYYKINIHGGEATKAFRINKSVSAIKEVNENMFLFTAVCSANKVDLDSLSEEEKAKELENRKEDKDYEVLDEIPFWSNGEGFTNKLRNRLFIFDAALGKSEAITDKLTNVEYFQISEDGKYALFLGEIFENKMKLTNRMFLLDLSSRKFEDITPYNDFGFYFANFLGENQIIFNGTDMKHYGLNENAKFYKLNLASKEAVCLTPDFETSLWNSVGSDSRYGGGATILKDGKYIYFITTEYDSSFINRIDCSGNIEKVTANNGSVDCFTVNNGNIMLVAMRDSKLQELYKLENGSEIQITDFNGWIQKERSISKPEKIVVTTAPGVEIEGWVIKPQDFDENKKYPAILDIHGGPKTVYGDIFFNEMQYWASEGYAVFFCNPRGSDGRGNDFADIRGKYGTIDYDDLMKFTDAVLGKCTFIDPDRLAVTGGSYGGFMTNWIIGHTDRFKAAAPQRSIANWMSKFCTTDIGYFFVEDQCAGTPWNNQEKLWEHSPLKYADKVKTPTLFLHSEQDYRCWLAEGIQMYTAVKYHGVPARLIMFRGENHELSRSGKPKHKVRRLKEITEWFDKYVKNR